VCLHEVQVSQHAASPLDDPLVEYRIVSQASLCAAVPQGHCPPQGLACHGWALMAAMWNLVPQGCLVQKNVVVQCPPLRTQRCRLPCWGAGAAAHRWCHLRKCGQPQLGLGFHRSRMLRS